MVGLLLSIGSGNKQPMDVISIIEAKDRTKSVKTAPPEGLYLKKVWYQFKNVKNYDKTSKKSKFQLTLTPVYNIILTGTFYRFYIFD